MSINAGDLLKIEIEHDIGVGRTLQLKSDTDNDLELGGFEVADDKKNVTTTGDMIIKQNRILGSFTVVAATDNKTQDLQYLQDIQDSGKLGTFTFTHINGNVYSGQGIPVGTLTHKGNEGTIDLPMNFEQKLEQITSGE